MNRDRAIIEQHLRSKCMLSEDALEYELNRFRRYPHIASELATVLSGGRAPLISPVRVRAKCESFTARRMMKKYGISSVYGAYSLLTQLLDNPDMADHIRGGLVVK